MQSPIPEAAKETKETEQAEQTTEQTNGKPIPREVRKRIVAAWGDLLMQALSHGLIPKVLISVRVDSHVKQQMTINTMYPGLTAEQSLPLLEIALKTTLTKAKREEITSPRIIVP